MEDYEKHVIDSLSSNKQDLSISYCGQYIDLFEFAFTDAEHMLNSIKTNGRLLCCPKCKVSIFKLLE